MSSRSVRWKISPPLRFAHTVLDAEANTRSHSSGRISSGDGVFQMEQNEQRVGQLPFRMSVSL